MGLSFVDNDSFLRLGLQDAGVDVYFRKPNHPRKPRGSHYVCYGADTNPNP